MAADLRLLLCSQYAAAVRTPLSLVVLRSPVVLLLLLTACTSGPADDSANDRVVDQPIVDRPPVSAEPGGSDRPVDADADRPAVATFGAEDPSAAPFLFSSNRSGVFQIRLRRGDESVALTDDDDYDSWSPRLSPDGTLVLLIRSPVTERPPLGTVDSNGRAASLWTMRLDGSGLQERIPITTFEELWPATWSPDGTRVLFAAVDRGGSGLRIWTADTERYTARPIAGRDELSLEPDFGPDGRQITYVGFPAGYRGPADATENFEIFVANADGSGERRLTFDQLEDRNPTWSPDGGTVAFETAFDPNYLLVGKWGLRSVDVASAAVSTVLSDDNVNGAGRWHRSEAGLFFERFEFGGSRRRLAYVNGDGSGLQILGDPSADYDDITIEPIPAAIGSP